MATESAKSPKAHHRFGFSGSRKRTITASDSTDASVSPDEVLESLTREATSRVGVSETQTQTLDILTENNRDSLQEQTIPDTTGLHRTNDKGWGRYAIVIMGVTGMVAVWFYSSGRNLINQTLLETIFQRINLRSVFANPNQFGIMCLASFAIASWIALRRRSHRIRLTI